MVVAMTYHSPPYRIIQLLSYDIGISLKLEARWYDPKNTIKHAVPFLSRNLLYVRRANHGVPKGKKRAINREQHGQKKLDLLLELFHHETENYNAVNGKKRSSAPTEMTNKKRKLNDSESVDNTNHVVCDLFHYNMCGCFCDPPGDKLVVLNILT